MYLFKRTKIHKTLGFSLVEIIVVLVIVSILSAIAIPKYLNSKNKAYYQTALNDGENAYTEITNVVSTYSDSNATFGSTDGTITYTSLTNTITMTLGLGAVSPGSFIETFSNSTTLVGKTYANTLNWCIAVANNSQTVIYDQDGLESSLNSCP